MKIYSSFYDNLPNFDAEAYTLVRVSRKAPPDPFLAAVGEYVDLSDTFGPTAAMLADCDPVADWDIFRPRYLEEILGVLDKAETLQKLQEIYLTHGEKPLLLLCYETAEQPCHRRLIGDFLGLSVEEL